MTIHYYQLVRHKKSWRIIADSNSRGALVERPRTVIVAADSRTSMARIVEEADKVAKKRRNA